MKKIIMLLEIIIAGVALVGCNMVSDTKTDSVKEERYYEESQQVADSTFKYQDKAPETISIGDPVTTPVKDNFQFVYNEVLHIDNLAVSIYYYRDCITNLMYYTTMYYSGYGTSVSMTPYYKTNTEIYTYNEFVNDRKIDLQ